MTLKQNNIQKLTTATGGFFKCDISITAGISYFAFECMADSPMLLGSSNPNTPSISKI